MQKAFAIKYLTTAMDELDSGITDTVKFASMATGFNAEVICKWAFSFFTSLGGSQENIDTDFVRLGLSSDCGHGGGNEPYTIHDEDFRLQAREFVRANSSKKGEPNLTARQFREWVEATFCVRVCDSMAHISWGKGQTLR